MSLKSDRVLFMMGRMKTIMKTEDLTTINLLTNFLSGTHAVAFSVINDKNTCCPKAPSRRKRLTLYRRIQGELSNSGIRRFATKRKGLIGYCFSSW